MSNLIYAEAFAKGSGPTKDVVPQWVDIGTYSNFLYNSATGDLTEITVP